MNPKPTEDIRSREFVATLFNEMAQTYGIVNMISSLGFAYIWRRNAVNQLPPSSKRIIDLMAGGGECLVHIERRCAEDAEICFVDWSEVMCDRARATVARSKSKNSTVIHSDALDVPDENESFDAVVSTFGLKTLRDEEIGELATEIMRLLSPGGIASILEFSVPELPVTRPLFKLYVKYYVPFLGRIFLGNPDNYRLLWKYTEEFGNCQKVVERFRSAGFTVRYETYFLGSATQIICEKNTISADT